IIFIFLFIYISHMWGNTVSIKLPSSRKESVTVIGAISSNNDKLYYCFCNSTNQNDVLFFFEGLNSERSDLRLKGKVVVLDNHSSHITKEIRDYIQR
ncbi:MAG: transposase, partial [bacterium]